VVNSDIQDPLRDAVSELLGQLAILELLLNPDVDLEKLKIVSLRQLFLVAVTKEML